MIRRNGEFPVEVRERARGGEGSLKLEHLLTADEFFHKGRMIAKITLEPGCSMGQHKHEGEMELYYILSGEATVTDETEAKTLYPGDVMYTGDGGSHSIANAGKETLTLLAVIISK